MSSSDPPEGATRWRLDLAYDGRGLRGFAPQRGLDTVVGLLGEALARTLRLPEPPAIVGAGRTDAGVHALGQVVHVDLVVPLFPDDRGPEARRLADSLNAQLAGRVRVLDVTEVPATFHARFSATWRAYRYLVLESAPPALELTSSWSWAVAGPLDLAAMNRAGASALGEHDFRSFCRRPDGAPPEEPLVRRVLELSWERRPDEWTLAPQGAGALRLWIRASAFCHQMVRSLTSTMVAIGQGRLAEATLAERLAVPRREGLPAPAPAAGLALVAVGYPDEP
ncbi:MAG: tRNA pseudouridine(38-40) synthase TruA [Acidobacteriota bacterium]|nr:tRNA pseudouridine(38-40) synthase TruA [Acidobacteriota bacterium]